jgi:CheY-like chemotaxis protein
MPDKIHVLIADDEPLNLELMEEILEDDYNVDFVTSGQACLDFLKENKPDILLLDVAMPNMNGYEVCKIIKEDDDLDLPVIFVSARGTIEDRLTGYEAGGDDYLVKPFNCNELLVKVQHMVAFINQHKELDSQLQCAQDMSMMIITNSGEVGVILNFVRKTFECNDLNSLSDAVFEALDQYDLHGTIQYFDQQETIETYDFSGITKPVEADLLELARSKGRIFNFNQRSIFNFENSSLLIKNMPEDEEKNGRFLDHLCMLMEGLNARFIAISQIMQVQKNALKNKALLESTKDGMMAAQKGLELQGKKAVTISQKLIHQIERDFLSLGLDDDQERYLVQLIENSTQEISSIYETNEAVDQFFGQMVEDLK